MTDLRSSLRERSKAKRRVAIQRAAMRLFAERGYDSTTIAEIADEAEVAPRTVSLYFPTKLDIAMSTSSDAAERLAATFQTHPALPFSGVVDLWLRSEADATEPDLGALTAAMLDANPGLQAVSNSQVAEASGAAGPAFIAELALAPDDPMVRIAGAAVGAAISEYLRRPPQARADDVVHQEFVRFMKATIQAARRA